MDFVKRSDLEGKHAFLSPSTYHWLNYTEDKLAKRWVSWGAARRGTDLHNHAHESIRLGIKLAPSNKALAKYVNDGIGYKMECEVCLFYSENCFGHADTISFRRNTLRIHDLKTGVSATSEHQLEVYAALFCLQYGYSPYDIEIELRIYQGEDVRVYHPHPDIIRNVMDIIVERDMQIEMLKDGEL